MSSIFFGPGSVIGITTGYGPDGTGIESRGSEIFRTCPDRPWSAPSLLHNVYRASFPGVKRPGRAVDYQPSSSAEVKERVELYFFSPLWAFLASSRVSFTFTFTFTFTFITLINMCTTWFNVQQYNTTLHTALHTHTSFLGFFLSETRRRLLHQTRWIWHV